MAGASHRRPFRDARPDYSRSVAVRLLPGTAGYPTELLWNLTLRELRSKFKRSTLGWLWSVINPLASIAIYTVVFGVCSRSSRPAGDPSGLDIYGFFLVCGLLPWTFLANGLNGAAASIVGNEGLVKKVYFPRWVLPAASALAWLASFGVELVVLGVVLLFFGNFVLPWIPVLLLMVLQTGFVLGLGLLLSAANAYFRDVQHFLGIFLNIWFYCTPILSTPTGSPPSTTRCPASASSAGPLLGSTRWPVRRRLPQRALQPALADAANWAGVGADLGDRWRSEPPASAASSPAWPRSCRRGGHAAIAVDDVAKRSGSSTSATRPSRRRSSTASAAPVHEEFWALDGRLVRGRGGRDLRPDRPQRLGQEHAAQVPGPHLPARPGAITAPGPHVGLLELGAGFHPELSGRENVYLNGSILGMSAGESRRPLRRDRRASPGSSSSSTRR